MDEISLLARMAFLYLSIITLKNVDRTAGEAAYTAA